jgi:ATP phosphoribosyltransferase
MAFQESSPLIRFALPKGRMQDGVFSLMAEAGIHVRTGSRGYRPDVGLPGFETKILKPQSIVEMLHVGSRDIGFAGADWVAELEADVIEVLDTGLDQVQLVAAAPLELLVDGCLPRRHLIVASEYERLSRKWIQDRGMDAVFIRSFGATEVFPPEDADCIVDNSASGSTLRSNNLEIVDRLMNSSTRLYANPRVLEDSAKREALDGLVLVLRSVLEARTRVIVEVNVPNDCLEAVIALMPAMRQPTVSRLHKEEGYAVKSAVPRRDLPGLIPRIKAAGGTDIVVSAPSQIVA